VYAQAEESIEGANVDGDRFSHLVRVPVQQRRPLQDSTQ
jgi:hypothetical protein